MEVLNRVIEHFGKIHLSERSLPRDTFKTPPSYPPHPPMPAFRHPVQVLHIPADYQSPKHSGTAGN